MFELLSPYRNANIMIKAIISFTLQFPEFPKIIELRSHIEIEGVVVAKKDFNQAKHEEIDTKNLYVIKALQSLTSKGYVKTQFSWQYYYYTLTEEGVEYLREYLNLPEHIVPGTYIQERNPSQRPQRRY
ncbi:ribosomal 40S subunit protein S10B [Saccharomyces cerevisiae]|nr:ribosomal 40S subunit protein S10B [Saccharomyces cerevisiae]